MPRRIRTLATDQSRGRAARALWALLLTGALSSPNAARAADEECDLGSTLFASPADNLCVAAIGSNVNFVIDGFATEWTAGTFYDHDEWFGGSTQQGRVRVSRKATGINKSDLFLFFEVTGDSVAHKDDEIRIGLNPGTTAANTIAANTTLIKIHPFNVLPTPFKETFTFNSVTGTWPSAGSGDPWLPPANISVRNVPAAGTWFVEMKISLDAIPVNPITTADFRLYMELHAAVSNVDVVLYQWPAQTNFLGEHNFICSNPNRHHPMSFATGAGGNCPHQDLHIANGLYSCGDVYILRGGAKSQEIAVNQQNEFHADVTNPGPGSAPNAEVYLTLLQLGTSTAPLAANYDHTNAAIVNFFNSKYGAWMTATDKLDTGTPKPPVPFTVNVPKNIAARFTWKPSDETRFGPPANFVASHKCTAAFVNFKDDPNFANNFSYCNTSIVACPTGQICPLSLSVGQIYPYVKPVDGARARLVVSAINEPFPGWFKGAQVRLEGEGLERTGENVFEIRLPEKGNVPLKLSIVPPRQGRPDVGVVPQAEGAAKEADALGADGDPIKDRNARLRRLYGKRPLLVIQDFVATSFKTESGGTGRVPLHAPTSYVAFAVGDKAGQHGRCGKSYGSSYAASSLAGLLGLGLVWHRVRRRPEATLAARRA